MLIKNAEALEILEKVDTLVVDKTGTLTEGKPRVVSITSPFYKPIDETILRLAASLERASEHPLARPIVEAAAEEQLKLSRTANFNPSREGRFSGKVDGRRWRLESHGAVGRTIGRSANNSAFWPEVGPDGTVVFVSRSTASLPGSSAVADPIKESTPDALRNLQRRRSAYRDAHRRQQRTAAAVAQQTRHR